MLHLNHFPKFQEKRWKSLLSSMKSVVFTVSLVLAGCQTSDSTETLDMTVINQETKWTYKYSWNSEYINFILSHPIEEDFNKNFPNPNILSVPRLRWATQELPSHNYNSENHISLKESLNELGTTSIGEAQVHFFKEGIIQIVITE